MNNNIKTDKSKALLAPVVSFAAFLLLVFGAGYAYYTSTATYNTAYGNVVMPARQTFSCTKTDGSVSIPYSSMWQNKAGTIAGTASAKITCTCSGSGSCSTTVTLKNAAAFTPIYNNEVTGSIIGSGCTAKTNQNIPTAGLSTTCTGSFTATGNIQFWNINASQDNRAGLTFRWSLTSSGTTFS